MGNRQETKKKTTTGSNKAVKSELMVEKISSSKFEWKGIMGNLIGKPIEHQRNTIMQALSTIEAGDREDAALSLLGENGEGFKIAALQVIRGMNGRITLGDLAKNVFKGIKDPDTCFLILSQAGIEVSDDIKGKIREFCSNELLDINQWYTIRI